MKIPPFFQMNAYQTQTAFPRFIFFFDLVYISASGLIGYFYAVFNQYSQIFMVLL